MLQKFPPIPIENITSFPIFRGISVATSRGYGGTAPVASNKTILGQQKNRRVELWIK
ncbi:MAG: hypothetical protein KZQ81_08995 [Candidatus Thiodiazotropha sp. (ex Rostrolucina anterorostrata)]|nr:hypothetical protein [Candidatus Thiodiazotropha sp. (ex Rostrolucina anterorostrata)]